ncbi:MAG: 5-bromo-4-chloroindolyl phosphate hydrolysis family protein [Lachnospiraceae bacterium]|nr:5-bromo-4-chloroindolyl phosphate hydrolysis family protein [Lachnospiraceae bacterium]
MAGNKNNQFYNNLGNEIKKSLTEGLKTGDFSGLNNAITDSVNSVIKDATNKVSDVWYDPLASKDVYKTTSGRKIYSNYSEAEDYAKMLQERRRLHNEAVLKAEKERLAQKQKFKDLKRQQKYELQVSKENLPVKFNPIGKKSGSLCVVGGTIGTVLFGLRSLVALFAMLFNGATIFPLIVPGVLLASSLGLMKYGLVQKGMYERAKKYAMIAGNNMYAQISMLSSSLGLKASRVTKDIKKMLRKGYFPEGYLDAGETTLMLSNDVFKQYEQTMKNADAAKMENLKKAALDDELMQEALSKLDPSSHTQFTEMVVYGRDCTKRLHELNDDIPGESISRKLDALENTLVEIFRRLMEHPEQMNRMNKLMDYYLPTMIKLVEAYAEYDKVSTPGTDIIKAKEEIENTLDTINEAFVQLLNNLFRDSVWDVTTDAQVLQTVLKQEGLAKDIEQ